MGNYKFRFSNMIPNAWFFKLRDMSLNPSTSSSSSSSSSAASSASSSHKHSSFAHPRTSHYFTRELRISQHRRAATCDRFLSTNDVPELVLPPIKTKPSKNAKRERQRPPEAKTTNANANANATRRKLPNVTPSSSGVGVRLRVHSPKIGGLRGGKPVRSTVFSDSFVVVKTSMDPYGDFKSSMMEMIVENGIRSKKDLEDLLASYLSLNSIEYHDLIVAVFKQIWFDFICIRSK